MHLAGSCCYFLIFNETGYHYIDVMLMNFCSNDTNNDHDDGDLAAGMRMNICCCSCLTVNLIISCHVA